MFSATCFQSRNLVFCSGVLLLCAVLGACTPITPSGFETSRIADTQVATTMARSDYPAPETTLTLTPPLVFHNSLIATPLPGERVVVGEIKEIPEPRNDFTYRRELTISKEGFSLMRLFVQSRGSEIRLGDDNGYADAESNSNRYLIWTYRTFYDDAKLPIKSGLYAYEVETGKVILIAKGHQVGLSETDGIWVLFTSWEDVLTTDLPRNDTPGDVRPLLAYNIASGETFTLSTSLPVIAGRMLQSFYGVSGDRAGWIEYDMQTQQYVIKVSNLDSGQIQTLKVPDLKQPRFFSISGDLAVWRDSYWHGYSLAHDALFTVPYAPPGWETSEASIMVIAKNSMLEWEVRVSESERRYFNAPVIPYGHGPTAWDSLVIPFQQTIAPPTPPPLESAPLTAYP